MSYVDQVLSSVEDRRLNALRDFAILDTLPEERFDRLTALAASLFDVPIALVSLLDEDRQWFKSRVGLDATETPREWAFCDHAIRLGPHATMVVQNAAEDSRFAENPLVTGDPEIRFYAGAALTTDAGDNLGTLCVIDRKPRRPPSKEELNQLSLLANMVVDELELHRATRAMAEQKRLLELAESMSGIGHWRFDTVGGRIDWSNELYRIFGFSPADFVPSFEVVMTFFHPDDRERVNTLIAQAMLEGNDYTYTSRIVRPDGEVRHVSSKASCERDAAGRTIAIVGVFQDITAEVRTLAAVSESEARYRLLTENANDIVTEAGLDGRFTYVSPAARAMTGYSEDEIVGRQALDLVHPSDRERVEAELAEAIQVEESRPLEHRHIRKDGRVIWVQSRPKLARDPETGRAFAVTDVMRDITERKQLELDLEAARHVAEEAAAVKSQFLANMSHELRTPLTSILGFAGLLRNDPSLGQEAKRYVARVGDASDALLATVNDILDFSKLEAGQVEIAPRPVDPTGLLKGAVELLQPQASAKGLSLSFDHGELPPMVQIDDSRIRQVLLNLLGNAVKFTASGGVTLSVRHESGVLHCKVVDTGPGIPSDRLERLFRRFSQVDASTSRSHGGSGLGLAICKGLVEAMSGRIGVRSLEGQGASFWVELPAPIETAHQADPLAGVRVLVVEENIIVRELMRIALSSAGAAVTCVADARGAAEPTLGEHDVLLCGEKDGASVLNLDRWADRPLVRFGHPFDPVALKAEIALALVREKGAAQAPLRRLSA